VSAVIAERIQDLQESAHLNQGEVGRIVGASARTVSRWEKGAAAPQPNARQRQPEERNLWIFSPNRLLDHDSPADRISQGDYRSVVALIEALADGVVV